MWRTNVGAVLFAFIGAASIGSALAGEGDLRYRNLGGNGVVLRGVGRHEGTLTTRVTMTAERLYLIDGTALAYRSHFAFATSARGGLTTKAGKSTSAIFGKMANACLDTPCPRKFLDHSFTALYESV